MISLKRSFFLSLVFLLVLFVLGEADRVDKPIIDFANYFYVMVLVSIPVTILIPGVYSVHPSVPMVIWACAYLAVLQIIDRSLSSNPTALPVIILEFIFLEIGVWIAHKLTLGLRSADSMMDALAVSAFPNGAEDINEAHQRIKIEITRSRRYHRPLCLVAIDAQTEIGKITKETIKSLQSDLANRFVSARVGQIIEDRIRQTDIFLRDRRGRYFVLCPETELQDTEMLANRIVQAIEERMGIKALWGVASFPDEALTFEDLLEKARERFSHPKLSSVSQSVAVSLGLDAKTEKVTG